jgi:glucose-6-phosphate 1-epimerase
MTDLSAANARFGLSGQISFKEIPGGLVVVEVANRHGNAAIALQGGHVMSWQPKSQAEPVVWLSRFAKFAPGKSIRGGAPVCWPWFGPHATDPGLPAHGFARTVPWEVTATRELDDGASEIALTLVETDQTRAMWPHRAGVSLRVTVGATLEIALTTQNRGDHDLVIGEALHTYFQIGDIGDIRIRGLEGCEYLDKAGGGSARRRQEGPVVFSAETDRIYQNTEAECVIEDARLQRRIRVAKSGSRSTVVWNPWTAKADKMGDFGPDGWRHMVCVESANAAENVVTIIPGAEHRLWVRYAVEALS